MWGANWIPTCLNNSRLSLSQLPRWFCLVILARLHGMSIFSRRTVQDLIEQGSRFLTSQEIASKLRYLEAGSDETIPTEWELAVLVAFSQLGPVVHEPVTAATRPDLQFTPHQSSNSLIIDIRTVSDKRLHEENPYELLMEDFRTRLHKAFPDQSSGNFHLEVRPIWPMPVYRDR